ncbi:MAG: hypothetical protein WCD81_11465 [Candidatus Bathyarchaeia archaeon]
MRKGVFLVGLILLIIGALFMGTSVQFNPKSVLSQGTQEVLDLLLIIAGGIIGFFGVLMMIKSLEPVME